MRNTYIRGIFTLAFVLFFQFVVAQQVVINEFVASNYSINSDPDTYSFGDWIELYNSGTTAINIGGWYMSDDVLNPQKWQFPANTTIEAKKFLLIWADANNLVSNQIHTNFKLDADFGTIILTDNSGNQKDKIEYAEHKTDISFGRQPDGSNTWLYFGLSTPAKSNQTIGSNKNDRASEPIFSLTQNFYPSAITVSLSGDKNSIIYYTLDGSEPSERSAVYLSPIRIAQNTVVRAKAYEVGVLPSKTIVVSYFIGENSSLPIMAVTIDNKHFKDSQTGFYVEGANGISAAQAGYGSSTVPKNYNRSWQRPVFVNYFDASKNRLINEEAQISIYGNENRDNVVKSLIINFDGAANVQFFNKKYTDSFNSIVLHSAGNDASSTKMKNAVMQNCIANNLNMNNLASEQCLLFINGKFWGLYQMREPSEPSNVTEYQSLIDYVTQNSLSADANYNIVAEKMDIDVFIDFIISEIYSGTSEKNALVWKPITPNSKLLWQLKDVDNGFQNPFTNSLQNTIDNRILFRKLLENNTFKDKFIDRYILLLSTTFAEQNLKNEIELQTQKMQTDMVRHINLWKKTDASGNPTWWNNPSSSDFIQTIPEGFFAEVASIAEWNLNVQKLKQFAQYRSQVLIQQAIDKFGLHATSNLLLKTDSPLKGIIELNGVRPTVSNYEAQLPINETLQLKAVPNSGYIFDSWDITTTSAQTHTLLSKSELWKTNATSAILNKEFNVSNANQYKYLNLKLLCANGAVIYLNGAKILDFNMPVYEANNIPTYSATQMSSNDTQLYYPIEISEFSLLEGKNTITVDVHASSASNTDLVADLQIDAQTVSISTLSTSNSSPLNFSLTNNVEVFAKFTNATIVNNVFINEVVSSNSLVSSDEAGDFDDWIEIFNNNNAPINIGGWIIEIPEKSTRYQIPNYQPDATTIPAKSHLLLWADFEPSEGVKHLGFRISKDGNTLKLIQKTGETENVVHQLQIPALPTDISYGCIPDGSSTFSMLLKPTPAATNQSLVVPKVNNLVINEFMTDNFSSLSDEHGEYDDWIEILNKNTQAVNIGGMFLSDNKLIPTLYRIPDNQPTLTTIPAGAYLILWADNSPEQGALHLGFGLSNDGEDIVLSQYTGNELHTINSLTYTEQWENISGGYYSNNTYLETFVTPTPSAANVRDAAITGIFINEFMASNQTGILDESGEYVDWIELYNSNNYAVNIGGLFITDSIPNSTMQRISTTNSALTTIQPKGFILFMADNDEDDGILHLDFKLKSAEEDIALFQALGNEKIMLDAYSYSQQDPDISLGRVSDGASQWTAFLVSTPNASNNTVSVDDKIHQLTDIQIFPNPIIHQLNIRSSSQVIEQVELWSIDGKCLSKLNNIQNTECQLNVRNLLSGIYSVNIRLTNGAVHRHKIVKY